MNVQRKISHSDMKSTIKKSGYLIEQRICPSFEKRGFQIEVNAAYKDDDTGKSREIDIKASSEVLIGRGPIDSIYSRILCECENNFEPIVFFVRKLQYLFNHIWNIRCSGFPLKVISEHGFGSDIREFLNTTKFHHYCKQGPFASQYCSFHQKDKDKPWIAMHLESQHDALSSLVKCLDFEKYRHSEIRIKGLPCINLTFYYPLLILQGDLYIAFLNNNRLTIKKSDHVQYLKNYIAPKIRLESSDCYQIDVITERYLPKYLDMIAKEMKIIKGKFIESKNTIDNTIKLSLPNK